MNTLDSLIIIAVAALIHASFQLSVSVLTLLSSHTIGAKKSHARLLRLTNAYALGVGIMTLFVLSTTAMIVSSFKDVQTNPSVWIAICGSLIGVGITIWIFYYRKEQGTTLWLPRSIARYVSERTKATKQSGEAFGLGLSSVMGELVFIIFPVLVAALLLTTLEPLMQLVGIALYSVISLSSLFIVNGLIGSGHRISHIQRWREENKRFIQFVAGSGLIVLGAYLYVDQVLTPTVMAAAKGF